ncbi:MAG: hypothetical protein MUP13_04765 [Thermoanaerobaculales bacterium]|nr:hypothetical protein [Thermoanaerobaculales bacterium]
MTQDHDRFKKGVALIKPYRLSGQRKSRAKIRENTHAWPKHFPYKVLSPFLICQNEQAFGMGVVHIPMGQEGMKQGFDGGIRGAEMDLMDLQLVLHLLIRKVLKGFQPLKLRKLQSDHPLRAESGQIGSAPFDIEDIPLLPQDVLDLQFDRGVPSAMKNKARIPPDQTGGV